MKSFTLNMFFVLLLVMLPLILNGCDREKLFEENYAICIINDSPAPISIYVSSGWEQDLEPYENTGGLHLIYYIPKTETIKWTRDGKEYREEIPIKKLLDGYSKVSGDIYYIIRGDNHILIKYEVDDNLYFLKDDPGYKQLRENNDKLVSAIKSNDIETAKTLIESGVSVNPQSSLFENPLRIAVDRSFYDISKLLLENNAKIEPMYFYGDSALTVACKNGDVEMIKLLLDGGANINYEGDYPLSEACEQGNYEAAKLLIENGANPNPAKYMSQPPMACAIRSQNVKVFKLLLDNGVSLDTEWATSTFRDYAYKEGGEEIVAFLNKTEEK